jgi:predicted MFS family arabinose efflux permease
MTTTCVASFAPTKKSRLLITDGVTRRLLPLQLATLAGGVAFWLPIEKLFMTQLGFNAGTIGLMAAAYGAAVPLLEIPSGILADRWSRRGVLMAANGAALCSVLMAAFSHSVLTYILSALMLGVFFALQSGNVDAMVYDIVTEATGESTSFERHLARLHLTNSAALVVSALVGGVLASATSPRATYLMTAPFVALSIVVLGAFREPTSHRAEEPLPLRAHIATTYTTILQRGALLPVVAALVLSGALVQALLEFGPLWLIDLHASAVLYGPITAGCTASLGLGAVLAARVNFHSPLVLAVAGAVMTASSLVLVIGHSILAIAGALVTLTLVAVAATTYLTRLLHDALPSSLRSGVSSGVSTLSWVAFIPGALLMGFISRSHGVHTAGWLMVVAAVSLAALVARAAFAQSRRHAAPGAECDLGAEVAF